jgi:hypothetical protein
MGDPKIGPGSSSPPQVSGPDSTSNSPDVQPKGGESQKRKMDFGFPKTDTFESKPHVDLFPKDVLSRAAKMTPQQEVNAHLNMLKNATSSGERAAALRGLRESLSKMDPGEQAKVLTDSKVMETIKEIIKDPQSPAAAMLKDLLRGTVGDVVKVLQAVKPDVGLDPKKGGVQVDVPKLLDLLKKDYKDILKNF